MKNQTASLYHLRGIIGSVRLQMGGHGDDNIKNENEKGIAEPTQENEGEESLPVRLPEVSFSGRRTTRFVLR